MIEASNTEQYIQARNLIVWRMHMSLVAIPIALLLVIGVGAVVARTSGWRVGLGAALATLLITSGLYVGLIMIIVGSMD